MHVFQIRGFSGILFLILALAAAIVALVLLPASFFLVLWNAVIFEGFHGPEISFLQGFLMWGTVASLLLITLKPQLQVSFVRPPGHRPVGKPKPPLAKAEPVTRQAEPSVEATMESIDTENVSRSQEIITKDVQS